jgi:hypothetical protein
MAEAESARHFFQDPSEVTRQAACRVRFHPVAVGDLPARPVCTGREQDVEQSEPLYLRDPPWNEVLAANPFHALDVTF